MKNINIQAFISWYLLYLFPVGIDARRLIFQGKMPGNDTILWRHASLQPTPRIAHDSRTPYIDSKILLPVSRKSELEFNHFKGTPSHRQGFDTNEQQPVHYVRSIRDYRFQFQHRMNTSGKPWLPFVLVEGISRSSTNDNKQWRSQSTQNKHWFDASLMSINPAPPTVAISASLNPNAVDGPETAEMDYKSYKTLENGNKRVRLVRRKRAFGLKVPHYRQPYEVNCPALPVTTRTIVSCTKGRKIGSKCSLRCANGFVLGGNRRSRRCRLKSHRSTNPANTPFWTGKQKDFQCVPICKPIKSPQHGSYSCKMVDVMGGRAFQCKTDCIRGYKVSGSTYRMCLENGEWSGQPSVCKASATRHTEKVGFKFQEHQSLSCGEVHSLASFQKDGVVHLVAGDRESNAVKIFRWDHDRFGERPHQNFYFPSPHTIEVLTDPGGTIWLVIAGPVAPVTLYRLHSDGYFRRSHTTALLNSTVGGKEGADSISFAEMHGEYYRCYGRNRRDTPVIVVHKLQGRPTPGTRDVFRRIVRKKLPGERVHQCYMYTEGNSLYTVATLNKPDGRGRVIIGHLKKNRMKTVDVVSGSKLRQVSDSLGFSVNNDKYIAISQATQNGQCLVYKRFWRNRSSLETG